MAIVRYRVLNQHGAVVLVGSAQVDENENIHYPAGEISDLPLGMYTIECAGDVVSLEVRSAPDLVVEKPFRPETSFGQEIRRSGSES